MPCPGDKLKLIVRQLASVLAFCIGNEIVEIFLCLGNGIADCGRPVLFQITGDYLKEIGLGSLKLRDLQVPLSLDLLDILVVLSACILLFQQGDLIVVFFGNADFFLLESLVLSQYILKHGFGLGPAYFAREGTILAFFNSSALKQRFRLPAVFVERFLNPLPLAGFFRQKNIGHAAPEFFFLLGIFCDNGGPR